MLRGYGLIMEFLKRESKRSLIQNLSGIGIHVIELGIYVIHLEK